MQTFKFISAVLFIFIMNANPIPEKYQDIAERLITASLADTSAYNRLAYLCDTFGPRLSGTQNLENAIDWILKELEKDSLSNVHGEKVKVPSWVRGKESARLIKPFAKDLSILGLGGSIGTRRAGIRGEVIVVDSFEELDERKEEVKGKFVLYNAAFTNYGETVQYRYKGAQAAAKYGAIASLIRSVGPWSLNTPHTGVMAYADTIPEIPHAALTMEDAMMLSRIHNQGNKIILELKMEARMTADKYSRNVIAELPGSEFPEEIVVLGGHIDSWDVGQGAHDDAGGCLAAWHAVKLIKKLGLKPRRTLRVVMWTNEENGGRGNKAYRDTHMTELDNHVVAIESDAGVFKPKGFGFSGSVEAMNIVRKISKLLNSLNADEITEGGRAADVAPLNDEGVPVMSLKVDGSKYFWYHHTNADTFDKVEQDELNRCVSAMAIMAFVLADLNEPLPR
ncbi:MAG: carboxypeptidase [Candidatus Marinimicrobia bacterium]|nr:carboxypeptidase [Candidatus Neomarinimicrobiota bacterium]